MKRKITLLAGILAFGFILYTGCYSDQFEPEPIIIDPVDEISLANDIVPIFEEKCNSPLCHATGAVPPDLTPPNAYESMINGGYVNTEDPTSSEFYLWLIGDGGRLIMPLKNILISQYIKSRISKTY